MRSSGISKQKSCVVTARLSFVPAKEMRFRLTDKRRDISRTRRFVSQFVERTDATVYRPAYPLGGGEEISSTTKSSGDVLIRPPIPGVLVANLDIPTTRSAVSTRMHPATRSYS